MNRERRGLPRPPAETVAVDRVRTSPRLLARFAASYRGRHDPADALDWLADDAVPSSRGTPGPGSGVDRERAYRPDATAESTSALIKSIDTLAADRAETRRALEAVLVAPARDERPGASRTRPARVSVGIALASGLVLVAVLGTHVTRPSGADRDPAAGRAEHALIASRGALAPSSYFRRFPAALGPRWRTTPLTSARGLDGATPVSVLTAGSRRLLLVVACSAADRSFEYRVDTGDPSSFPLAGFGVCGALHPLTVLLPPGSTSAHLLVTTRGVDPFSLAVYA